MLLERNEDGWRRYTQVGAGFSESVSDWCASVKTLIFLSLQELVAVAFL